MEDAQDDLRAFGAPSEVIEQLQGEESSFEVESANWGAVMLFMRVQTQWRVVADRPMGLDYVAVDVVMRRTCEPDPDGVLFDSLQILEQAALSAMRAR